jgi:sialate O-acetylesterase
MIRNLFFAVAPASLLAALPLHADVKLPAIFGDHMVLQQDMKLPVWGTADPGEAVTVTVGDKTGAATADGGGHWRVDLPALATHRDPTTVTVKGKNTVTFTDVLIGDVWICSGQSNMEFTMRASSEAATDIPKAADPGLRLFLFTKTVASEPSTEVHGHWELCTPESLPEFSAVGYYFGRDLRKALNRPIGLIGTYWGSTPAEAWTSLSGLEKEPALQHYVDAYKKVHDALPQATAAYPAQLEAYEASLEAMKGKHGPGFDVAVQRWIDEVKSDYQNKKPFSIAPEALRTKFHVPSPPTEPNGGFKFATNLFNGMINPLIPYGIKGAIWYQGEANANLAMEYRILFPRMITDWREKWGEGDFPFLFVQLAGFAGFAGRDNPPTWPLLRESQMKTLSLPNTGIATAIDIGKPDYIHPADKKDVGYRLSLAALHVAYGRDLVYSGPVYEGSQVKGHAFHVSFMDEGGGLIIGKAPWVAEGFQPRPTDKLLGFALAGADKKFYPADAKIVGKEVVVSSPQVPDPVAVRYDWENSPDGNLYNMENLPALPFRSDDWMDPTVAAIAQKLLQK